MQFALWNSYLPQEHPSPEQTLLSPLGFLQVESYQTCKLYKNLICSFCLSVAACQIAETDQFLRYTRTLHNTLTYCWGTKQTTTVLDVTFDIDIVADLYAWSQVSILLWYWTIKLAGLHLFLVKNRIQSKISSTSRMFTVSPSIYNPNIPIVYCTQDKSANAVCLSAPEMLSK